MRHLCNHSDMQTFSDIYERVPCSCSISNKSYAKHQALSLCEWKTKTKVLRSHVVKAVLALLLHTAEMLRVRKKGGDWVEFSRGKSF